MNKVEVDIRGAKLFLQYDPKFLQAARRVLSLKPDEEITEQHLALAVLLLTRQALPTDGT